MRSVRGLLDRIVQGIAKMAMLGWFRSVEVEGMDRIPPAGPVLVVAPHFDGFVDPALLASTLPRMPRFLAMARLWRVSALRPFLALAGAVPVQRASEGFTAPNVEAFATCHEVLRAGGEIAIFPEGRVNEKLRLLPLKTGAARIALGARRAGAPGIVIAPVGLVYEDRTAVRPALWSGQGIRSIWTPRSARSFFPGSEWRSPTAMRLTGSPSASGIGCEPRHPISNRPRRLCGSGRRRRSPFALHGAIRG